MKVSGASGPTAATPQRAASASGGGFAIVGAGAAGAAGGASAVSGAAGVAGVSALMALQGVEDPTERRRRAVRRGAGLLDRLEALKLAHLSGESPGESLQALSRALAELRPSADENPGLNGVLDQIDLRAAVELAKAELGRSPA